MKHVYPPRHPAWLDQAGAKTPPARGGATGAGAPREPGAAGQGAGHGRPEGSGQADGRAAGPASQPASPAPRVAAGASGAGATTLPPAPPAA